MTRPGKHANTEPPPTGSKPVPGAPLRVLPPAGVRLAEALKLLLKNKDFHSVTTAEIAETAQANEALIYRYFHDKRGLLHYVLAEAMQTVIASMLEEIESMAGPVERLQKVIHTTLSFYRRDMVFAKILLLEVRNFPGYFQSDTYQTVKYYSEILRRLVREGQKAGVLRDDLPAAAIRDVILGGIEHFFLPRIVLGRELDVDIQTDHLWRIIGEGIVRRNPGPSAFEPGPGP